MKFSCLLPFLFFLLSICSSSSQPTLYQPYSNCAPVPYTCGTTNFIISYPFQMDGRHDYCGYPGLYLNCTNNNTTLTITISNKNYEIRSIDYLNHLLNIVDTNFVNQSCPRFYLNTTIDATLFQYSDRDRNLTLYSNCTASSQLPTFYDIGCLRGVTGQHSYFRLDNGTTNGLLGSCGSTVLVPIGLEAAQKLVNGSLGFGDALQQGFFVRWLAGMEWCRNCVRSGGSCGFNSTSPADHTCFCPNGTAIDSCNSIYQGFTGLSEVHKKLIIGLCTGFACFLVGGFFFILRYRHHKKICEALFWKKEATNAKTVESFLEKYGSLATKRYTYSDVKKMTKSFNEKLGQGGYGTVFKGKLFDGQLVAVKVLSESKGNGEDFINEVASIGNTSHVNVVSLRGFCAEGSKRALIYDFMPNGSLEKYIYSEEIITKASLGWEKLYEIAIGIARGLEYLHQGCNTRIVHFDIKPHNILLDQDFCPKISDFGMAKLCPRKVSIISMYGTRGTIGYIAPEVFSRTFGVISSKSDVYSYGMMVLEMFGGKRNMNTRLDSASETYFPQWIYEQLDKNDLMAYGVTGETEEIARKMMIVGFWCIQTLPDSRPSMSRVVDMLEGSIKDLPIPPMPILSSPINLMVGSCTTSSS